LNQPIKISIVTITFNDLSGLQSTVTLIDDKITCSYLDTEHIIINGKPEDASEDYINSLIQKRKIKTLLISELDNGIYDAMNKGINKSTGDFIIFINSGDCIINNYDSLEILNLLKEQLINEKSAGVAFGCYYNVFNKKIKIFPRHIQKIIPRMPTLHQGLLYKRCILNNINFSLNYKICGDFENFCAIFRTHHFAIYNFIISELVAGGVSTNSPMILFKESRSIFKKYFQPNPLIILIYDIRLLISIFQFQIFYRCLQYFNNLSIKCKLFCEN